ncbi:MAG TPA: Sec-independent protein translocase protein TatB [Allosphingosinicella sp.]|jgi:sec-independent protein translocase protein TatB|nr:Sec-independent protein translocase protein TatB [Allosphingosinicella sp.]
MFGIDSGELLIIAVVALVVIGPKDLPRVMRAVGNFVSQARGMARSFRGGVDAMMRESELADMEKKWQADNDRIMREHPVGASVPALDGPAEDDWMEPSDAPPAGPKLDKAAKPIRIARPRPDRPKPPPRRAKPAISVPPPGDEPA